jgi:predicted metal-dependent phosphoesterase TrpH
MNTALNADLHCHSVVSDGTLTPEELAQRAKTQGVALWALTDHDEVGGQSRAAAAAAAVGMDYLSGVEISVSFVGQTVHIVGLGIDPEDQQLWLGLQKTRGGRAQRAREMSDGLARVGIHGAFEGALTYAGNHELISRTHFARFLVETGVCKDTYEVFRKYLTEGKPGFVEHRWATLKEAVSWITQSGGMAIIAHPARYGFSANEEFALFTEFKNLGGQGVEVVTGSHSAADAVEYAAVALEFDLAASRGSDFHSPQESRTELGSLPPLPDNLTPVWDLLKSRILRAPQPPLASTAD